MYYGNTLKTQPLWKITVMTLKIWTKRNLHRNLDYFYSRTLCSYNCTEHMFSVTNTIFCSLHFWPPHTMWEAYQLSSYTLQVFPCDFQCHIFRAPPYQRIRSEKKEETRGHTPRAQSNKIPVLPVSSCDHRVLKHRIPS